MSGKPTLGDAVLIERFAAYNRIHGAWGSLHIVLDDGNVRDDHVTFCREYATKNGDTEGAELAEILLTMSKTQRLRLPDKVYELERAPLGA